MNLHEISKLIIETKQAIHELFQQYSLSQAQEAQFLSSIDPSPYALPNEPVMALSEMLEHAKDSAEAQAQTIEDAQKLAIELAPLFKNLQQYEALKIAFTHTNSIHTAVFVANRISSVHKFFEFKALSKYVHANGCEKLSEAPSFFENPILQHDLGYVKDSFTFFLCYTPKSEEYHYQPKLGEHHYHEDL